MYGIRPRRAATAPPYTEHMKLFTQESWERLSKALEYTRTFGIPYELELQTVTKDGSHGWMWVRGEAKTDAAGNIVTLWGAAQDITERKRIEIELEQSEERFKLLFDKAPLGYQSLDADGCFIEVNQQWLDTFGYSREEVIGKWFGDFLCTEYVAAFQHCFPDSNHKATFTASWKCCVKMGCAYLFYSRVRLLTTQTVNFYKHIAFCKMSPSKKQRKQLCGRAKNDISVYLNIQASVSVTIRQTG